MTTQSDAPGNATPPKPPASAGVVLVVIVLVAAVSAIFLATELGFGASGVIAGYTAMFFVLGGGGGSLRAGLRKAAWFGPLMALSVSIPRILVEDHRWVALALACVVVFIACLLPALGPDYTLSSLTLGFSALMGLAVQTQTGAPWQTVCAAFVGVASVVVLRTLMSIRDPSAATRQLAAATLTADDPGFGQAYDTWLHDRSVRWIGEVLHGALGYRFVQQELAPEEAAAAATAAKTAAQGVAARAAGSSPAASAAPTCPPTDASAAAGAAEPHASDAWRAARGYLDRVEDAARDRDERRSDGASAARHALTVARLRSVLTWRSQILQHAVRTTVGTLLVFLIAWGTVGPHDPLVISMSMAAFAIMQIGWAESLRKARDRVLGVALGAVLAALALWLLPHSWLLPVAMVAAVLGMALVLTNQVWSVGCFVVLSIGMNVSTRGLDPARTVVEYIVLLAVAVGIGLLLGFVILPRARPEPAAVRIRAVCSTAADLLRAQGVRVAGERAARAEGTADSGSVRGDLMPVIVPLQRLITETANLRSALLPADERAGVTAEECDGLATRLETLAVLGAMEAETGRVPADALVAAAAVLDGGGAAPAAGTDSGPGDAAAKSDFERLAEYVRDGSESLMDRAATADASAG